METCALCGAERSQIVRKDFTFLGRDLPIVFPQIERYECMDCGEEYFSLSQADMLFSKARTTGIS